MDLGIYLANIPRDVLEVGTFCVTRHGDKQPYDPFKGHAISAKDEFYDILSLLDIDLNDYDTLGIKIIDPISTIDIDHCVVDGKANAQALDIIHRIKSYTEISPSGTGIRILFKAINAFDRSKYKIKNSKNGVEYYDGLDQKTKGGRMVRLSANQIFPEYDFREVDTTEMLDIYMAKEEINHDYINETGEPNLDKCFFIGEYLKKDYKIYEVYYRHMAILSESEWDLMLTNYINFYTRNINEVKYIFENSTYFKNKKNVAPKFHVNKWFNTGYGAGVLEKTRPSLGNDTVRKYADLFDEYTADESGIIINDLITALAIDIGFIKKAYIKDYKEVDIKSYPNNVIISHLMWIAKNRAGIVKNIQELYEGGL